MDFKTKASIVGECWIVTRKAPQWKELLEYGDLGFPLAYAWTEGFCENLNEQGEAFIEELYDLILASLDLEEEEYEDFEAMLDANIAANSTEE